MVSDGICVDLVVFSVCANEADPPHFVSEVELEHQAICVAFDVEYDPVVLQDPCARVVRFQGIEVPPSRSFGLPIPALQLLFAVGVLDPELA